MRRNASTHKLLPENEFEDFKEWSLNFLKEDRGHGHRGPTDEDHIRNADTGMSSDADVRSHLVIRERHLSSDGSLVGQA